MQLHEALGLFCLQLEADGRSPHTVNQYRRHIRQLIRWAEDSKSPVETMKITREMLARFLVSRDATETPFGARKKPITLNALRTSIRVFFSHLHEAGDIPSNPARMIRRAICTPPPPRALSKSDQQRLLDQMAKGTTDADRRDHVLFTVILRTGLRLGSALALDVADVDLETAELRVRQVKRGREHRSFFSDQVAALLKDHLGDRTSGPLFAGRSGERLGHRQAQCRLSLWAERAGLGRVTPHMLRHSFAMTVYHETRDILLTKRALGHQSIASTVIYVGVSDEALRAAIGA